MSRNFTILGCARHLFSAAIFFFYAISAAFGLAAEPVTGPLPTPANGYVDRWSGSSAVMIGPHHIITARHTGGGVGSWFWVGDTLCPAVEYIPEPTGQDLAIVRIGTACVSRFDYNIPMPISELPGWHPVAATAPAAGREIWIAGWGRVGAAELADGSGVLWGPGWGKTWGKNIIVNGSASYVGWTFNRAGTDDTIAHEANATLNDSGGGVFVQQPDGQLALVGVIFTASIGCTSGATSIAECSRYGGISGAIGTVRYRPWITSIVGALPIPTATPARAIAIPTDTQTAIPSRTPTPTITPTRTATPTITRTPNSTAALTRMATPTATPTASSTATASPIPIKTITPTASPKIAPTVIAIFSPTEEKAKQEIFLQIKKSNPLTASFSLMTAVKIAGGSIISLSEAQLSNCETRVRAGFKKQKLSKERKYSVDLTMPRRLRLKRSELTKHLIYFQSEFRCSELEGNSAVEMLDVTNITRSASASTDRRAITAVRRELSKLARQDVVRARRGTRGTALTVVSSPLRSSN